LPSTSVRNPHAQPLSAGKAVVAPSRQFLAVLRNTPAEFLLDSNAGGRSLGRSPQRRWPAPRFWPQEQGSRVRGVERMGRPDVYRKRWRSRGGRRLLHSIDQLLLFAISHTTSLSKGL